MNTYTAARDVEHPSWCDLAGDCTFDAPTILHRGRPRVLLLRAGDATLSLTREQGQDGPPWAALTVTQRDLLTASASPVTVDVHLRAPEIERLRALLDEVTPVSDMETRTFSTRTDAEQYVAEALGDYADDFDVPGITSEVFVYHAPVDERGQELLHRAGFVWALDDDECDAAAFWAIVGRHDNAREAGQ